MPKSKRNTVVSLTQTAKKDKEHKAALINQVREHAETFQYAWVFQVEHMRNNILKEVRGLWEGSKFVMGRNTVMKKALGLTEDEECQPGAHIIAEKLEGSVGLLFTNETPDVVTDWFNYFERKDFARSGDVAPETVSLPEGPILIEGEPAPHTLEVSFRKLGLTTSLKQGVPVLLRQQNVCEEGETLSPNQAQLLKLLELMLAKFKVVLVKGVDLREGKEVPL